MSIPEINHITLATKDLERSFQFYNEILEFKPLAKWSRGAYFLIGQTWFCISFDKETRTTVLPEYTHFSFSISKEEFPMWVERLKAQNVTEWKENKSEGDSFYFLDPDGHKLELHVGNWESRLKSMKAFPWEDDIEFFV